ncbi:MAG TPA: potassium-transporting ATPase subunit KdpA [Acidimicrobiales bacterium]|nr:potassium-transporting ATPase subunit KdpA [Acidimicrobiales bacterium]
MTAAAWAEVALLIVVLAVCAPLGGRYLAAVYGSGAAPGDRVFGWVERPIYRVCGIDPEGEQRWTTYAYSLLAFSLVSVLVLYAQLRLQGHLPLNPDHYTGVKPVLSFNTSISFLTNTNWQNYGDGVMSQLTQMAGLAFHNFVSAACGATVAVALVRGLVRRKARTLGSFWVDLVRTCVRVLLPLAFVAALVLMSQGVVQNLHGSRTVHTVAGASQVIPGGPVASQEAIKEGGQNGGGFFNANSSHPYENPNGVTDFVEIVLILLIPFSFPFMFGRMVGDRKQGYVVFAAMFLLWVVAALLLMHFEATGTPKLQAQGANIAATSTQGGGNMEGKEVRFGSATCGLFAASTTGTSTGAINCAHDSLTPLGGGTALVNMMLGEVSPGGTGAGLYGMLIFALLSVFIAGLMVGRTPEYLGKKIQAQEMKLVVLYILFVPMVILVLAGIAIIMPTALSSLLNPGPHGLSEMVYAYTSPANNNGSAFAGINGNTDWFNTTQAVAMFVGRFFLMIPVLGIAGSLGRKQHTPATAGTFPTGTGLFTGLLVGVVIIVVGLTFFPVVALGPIVEQLVGHF